MEKVDTEIRENVIFSWKNVIFCAYVVRCELILKWRNIDSAFSSNEQENIDKHGNESLSDDDVNNNEDDSPLEKGSPSEARTVRRGRDSETTGINTTSLSVGRWKHCEVVAASLSFDEERIGRVPVLLLQGRDKEESGIVNAEYFYVQVAEVASCNVDYNRAQTSRLIVTEVASCNVDYNHAQTSRLIAKSGNTSSRFELVPIRSYSLKIPLDLSTRSHPVFISSLQLLLVNPNHLSVTLYTRDTFSLHNRIHNFNLTVSERNLSDVQILDCFYVSEDSTLVTIIYFKTDEGQATCEFLKFSPNVSFNSDSASEKYELVQLPTDILFTQDFSEIMKVVQILSFVSRPSLTSASGSFCSSVVMITHTGYVLKFVDGAMSCCVNLLDHGEGTCERSLVNWSGAVIKIIIFEGCPDRTAVQINSSCHLIDWTREKIVRSWQSVLTAVPCDVQLCGISSLLLVFEPENEHFTGSQKSHLLLEDAEFRVVDVDCEFENDDEGNDHRRRISGSDTTRRADKVHTDEDLVTQPPCAVDALLGQQKKCEKAVTELESELQSKLSFLATTWQQLSNLHISDTSQSVPHRTSSDESPLAVVVEGSLPSSHHHASKTEHGSGPGPAEQAKRHTELGSFWKRIVDSRLVVGVSVRNVAERALTDIFLSIVPISGGQAHSLQSTCKCVEPRSSQSEPRSVEPRSSQSEPRNVEPRSSQSEPRSSQYEPRSSQSEGVRVLAQPGNSLQGQTGSMDFGQFSDLNRECLLPPGHSIVATCTADLSQAVSATDLRFHVFLSYLVLTGDTCSPGMQRNDAWLNKECCHDFVISSSDLLAGTYSVGISSDGSVSALVSEDLWALDCLQENWTLTVESVVSSVTCLSLKLTSHPSIRFLEWAEQFLVVDTHWLKYCRVQILEQSSRQRATIKVFCRSGSQVLLFIKFLYSILPEDITITPNTPSCLSALMLTGQTVLQDIDSKINTIKQQIDNLTTVALSGEEKIPQEESLSPKFHTKKNVKIKQEVCKPTSLGDASCSKPSESAGEMGDLVGERKLFRRARKRFREICGADSPDSA